MKISTRGRYGLRAMIELAANSERHISLKTIAERQGISENYLEQLFAPIKKAGLLASYRGARGGYGLTKPPNEITVGDVLRILEGNLSPVECVEPDGKCSCGSSNCDCCVTKSVWAKMYKSVNNVIDSITLKDLADDYQEVSTVERGSG